MPAAKKPAAKTATKTAAKKTATPKAKISETTDTLEMMGGSCGTGKCSPGSCCPTKNPNFRFFVLTWIFLAIGFFVIVPRALKKAEAQQFGGMENYKMVQEIYNSEGFQQQQKMMIENMLQTLPAAGQNGGSAPAEMPAIEMQGNPTN